MSPLNNCNTDLLVYEISYRVFAFGSIAFFAKNNLEIASEQNIKSKESFCKYLLNYILHERER